MDSESIDSQMDAFIAQGLITEVLGVVKGGKEATVYCCRAASRTGMDLLAAKLYRPLEERAFRNDAIYQAGRNAALRQRDQRALLKKTRHGRGVQSGMWIRSEFETLELLHAVGADVPKPVTQSGSALLMEYIGDREAPAPMLNSLKLPPDAAAIALDRILANVRLWLSYDRVHGDLSPYNILYWQGAPRIIDFPQAVDARMNRDALFLLERDVENVCRYFDRQGVTRDARSIVRDLWYRYVHAQL